MRSYIAAYLAFTVLSEALPAAAQYEAPPDIVRAGEASNAALRCAVLAALSVPTGERSEDAIRLARYALPLARKFNEWVVPHLLERPAATGTWGDFFAEVETDFWVGMSYSSASQWVEQRMSILAPIVAGQSSEDWAASRQLHAQAEYASQNCNLIGPQ